MLDSLKSVTAASQSLSLATLFEEKKRVAILAFSQAYTNRLGFEEWGSDRIVRKKLSFL